LSGSADRSRVQGCAFTGHSAEAVRLDGVSSCVIEGNEGCSVLESGAADNNVFDANFGFGVSTIIGPGSMVEAENFRNVRTWGAVGDGIVDDSVSIQAAIDALPASGGVVYFPGGTYLIGTTLTAPDKNVIFRGAGSGTIISLGASAIAAFTIPDGLSAMRRYTFENMEIVGTDVATQAGVRISDSNSRGVVTITKVDTTGVQYPIDITAGDAGYVTPVQVLAEDCTFEPLADGTSVLVHTPPSGDDAAGFVILRRVNFYYANDPLNAIGGTLTGNWWYIDYWIEDSILSLTGDTCSVGTINASGSEFLNFGAGFPEIDFFGSVLGLQDTCFTGCTFQSLYLVLYENFSIDSGRILDTQIDPYGNVATIRNCYIELGANTPIGITQSGAYLCRISGCHFATGLSGDLVATNYIESSTEGTTIDGCVFDALGDAGISSINLTANGCTVQACTFNDTALPPITDSAGQNRYADNFYYSGARLPSVSYFGPYYNPLASNGVAHFGIEAQTETGAFQNFLLVRAVCGIVGVGTVKNVGGDDLEVKEIVTDFWGTTDSVTNTVTAGNDRKLDPQANFGTARPPYALYQVQIRHLGVASNFDLMFSGAGIESPQTL